MLSPKLGLISVSVGWFGGAQTEIEKVRFVVRSRGPRPMPSRNLVSTSDLLESEGF